MYTFTFFTRVTPTFDMFRHGKPRGTSLVFRIYINHSAGKLFGTLLFETYLVVFQGLDISLVVLYSGFNVTFNSIFRTKLDCSACRLFLHSQCFDDIEVRRPDSCVSFFNIYNLAIIRPSLKQAIPDQTNLTFFFA